MESTRAVSPVNFSWIVKDQLAAMGYPRSREQLLFVVQQGIKHLVTLSPEKLPPVKDFPNLDWTLIAVEEFEPPTLQDMIKFIDICTECRSNSKAVGVHCRQGLGRTGVMVACYLVRFEGLVPREAIESVRRQRKWSIETYEQEFAVYEYYEFLRASCNDA